MGNLRPFQIVLFGIFGAMGVGGLIMLGAYQAKQNLEAKVYGDNVEIWGTYDRLEMIALREMVSDDIKQFSVIEYTQIEEDDFVDTIVNAIAEGNSPDLIILPSEQLVTLRPKLIPVSYELYPLRNFKDIFVDGAEIFTYPEGIYAVPFAVDPLVQYWNRDLFASAGLAKAPSTWEEVVNLIVPNITIYDNRRNILQSALAFGEYRNLTNPKALLMALAMQAGSRMVYLDGEVYEVALNIHENNQAADVPLEETLEFFVGFSNSNNPLYSWNRVQQNDKNAFLAGELATYYGLASEYQDIIDKNPNLNFDVAPIPQGSGATIKRTFGDFYGFAIPRAAKNPNGALAAARTMTSAEYAADYASAFNMISPRRSDIAKGSPDPAIQTSMNSALIARSWLDPNPERSDAIFKTMIENVVSNRVRTVQAVGDAIAQMVREF